jgi:Nucleotidyltransferase domain.
LKYLKMDKVEKIINDVVYVLVENYSQKNITFSRAKGENKPYSDIDLAVELKQNVDFRLKRKIKELIEDISGIYSVDIIYLNECSENFKNIVYETGKVLYEKS